MKKRGLCLLCILLLAFGPSGCGKRSAEGKKDWGWEGAETAAQALGDPAEQVRRRTEG